MSNMVARHYVMTNLLREIIERATSQKQLDQIGNGLEFYMEEYKRHKKLSPYSLAYSYHVAIDEGVKKMLDTTEEGYKASCSKGCAFCCFINVDILREEAKLLVEYIKEEKIPIDMDLLRKQALVDGVEGYRTLAYKDRRCVFLDKKDNSCKVYEHRPVNCRKYFVASAPQLCYDEFETPKVAQMAWTNNEMLATALMTAGEAKSLSKLLLEELQK